MEKQKAIDLAAGHLRARGISFSEPVRVEPADNNSLLVIFTEPEALDPNVVVDPPTVEVTISSDGRAELVPQM